MRLIVYTKSTCTYVCPTLTLLLCTVYVVPKDAVYYIMVNKHTHTNTKLQVCNNDDASLTLVIIIRLV